MFIFSAENNVQTFTEEILNGKLHFLCSFIQCSSVTDSDDDGISSLESYKEREFLHLKFYDENQSNLTTIVGKTTVNSSSTCCRSTLTQYNHPHSFEIFISDIQLYNKKNKQKRKYCLNKNIERCKTDKTDTSSLLPKRLFQIVSNVF